MIDLSISPCTWESHHPLDLPGSHLEGAPGEGDEESGPLQEAKHQHRADDEAVVELVEAEPRVVVDDPLEVLEAVEVTGPAGVGPPRLLQAVTSSTGCRS